MAMDALVSAIMKDGIVLPSFLKIQVEHSWNKSNIDEQKVHAILWPLLFNDSSGSSFPLKFLFNSGSLAYFLLFHSSYTQVETTGSAVNSLGNTQDTCQQQERALTAKESPLIFAKNTLILGSPTQSRVSRNI